MGSILDTDHAAVRDAAFQRLLRTALPATAQHLAGDLHRSREDVTAMLHVLAERGSIRLDDHGAVIGSGGLSVQPDRHQIDLDGRRFWTWCAYDILGIFAALGADGSAVSPTPGTDQAITLTFRDGRPQPADAVLLLPDERLADCCTNVYEQWCPNSNLFPTAQAATAWAQAHGVSGSVLALDTAAAQAGQQWRPLTGRAPRGYAADTESS